MIMMVPVPEPMPPELALSIPSMTNLDHARIRRIAGQAGIERHSRARGRKDARSDQGHRGYCESFHSYLLLAHLSNGNAWLFGPVPQGFGFSVAQIASLMGTRRSQRRWP
jgi:hypothetical protein